MPTPLTYADAYKLYADVITNKEARKKFSTYDLNIGIGSNNGNFYVIALDYQRTRLERHGYLECSVAHFVNKDFEIDEVVPSDQICLMHEGNRWEWE